MNRLYVLYDARCGLCRRAKTWVTQQPAYVPVFFMAAGSEEARQAFPSLRMPDPPEELIAISDEGHVYRNEGAWIMCLYALVETREWSLRLASPWLRPLARQAFTAVSHERSRISSWLGLDDLETAGRLEKVVTPPCGLSLTASTLQTITKLTS